MTDEQPVMTDANPTDASPEATNAEEKLSSGTKGGNVSDSDMKKLHVMMAKAPSFLKGIKPMVQKVMPYIEKARPMLRTCIKTYKMAEPYIFEYGQLAIDKFNQLPEEAVWGLFGFWLCFFGGYFPALILAAETMVKCDGWEGVKKAFTDLYGEYEKMDEAFDADNKKDEDGDGVADVEEISIEKNIIRKADLLLISINPNTVAKALGVIYGVWLAVIAVLRVNFAKTIALGAAIGDVTTKTVGRVAIPVLCELIPSKYHTWIPVSVQYFSRAIGVTIAWSIQSVISAFHSSVRGGFIMARMALSYREKMKGKVFNEEDSDLDEIIGYGIAILGFGVQMMSGFSLMFPLNLLFLPMTSAEWWLQYLLADSSMFNERGAVAAE